MGEVEKVLRSQIFRGSPKKNKILRYASEEVLLGNTITEKQIGIQVFKHSYDPAVDAHVRIAVAELRDMLRNYYANEGARDAVLIEWPLGSYTPKFSRRTLDWNVELSGYSGEVAVHQPASPIHEIASLADRVFGENEIALSWLREPNPATDNQAPLDLLATSHGFDRVKNLLLRIEYGVLA